MKKLIPLSNWLIGSNDLGLEVSTLLRLAVAATKSLHVDRINSNQGDRIHSGAFLLSLVEIAPYKIFSQFQVRRRINESNNYRFCRLAKLFMSLHLKRTFILLKPDQSCVLLRPFDFGDSDRTGAILARIMALPEETICPLLEESPLSFPPVIRI